MKFEASDFKSKNFTDYDKYNHLPKLALFIWNLTDCEASDKASKRIAVELAQEYLTQMRITVASRENESALTSRIRQRVAKVVEKKPR